jgi:hypothetical protein
MVIKSDIVNVAITNEEKDLVYNTRTLIHNISMELSNLIKDKEVTEIMIPVCLFGLQEDLEELLKIVRDKRVE